jgi:hypothetical protein
VTDRDVTTAQKPFPRRDSVTHTRRVSRLSRSGPVTGQGETTSEYMTERQDFLYVYAAPSVAGSGWDVVLRIDGTYADRADAEAAAQEERSRIDALAGAGKARRYWWAGPPWITRKGLPEMTETIITQRLLNEALRAERRATRSFLVAEIATTRRRLERLEARTFLGAGTPDYIDSYAADVRAEYSVGAEEPIE